MGYWVWVTECGLLGVGYWVWVTGCRSVDYGCGLVSEPLPTSNALRIDTPRRVLGRTNGEGEGVLGGLDTLERYHGG